MEPKVVLVPKNEFSVVGGGSSTHNSMVENSVKEEEEFMEAVPKARALVKIITPFLKKTYEMVDDPQTDEIVSWGFSSDSFVIWDPHKFSSFLLPLFFKHSNFSSFIRQLNTYGFRKVHVDRWEFANSGFKKGKKHLLKTIKRRSYAANSNARMLLQREGEVKTIEKEQDAMKVEILDMKQQQQNSDLYLASMGERLESVEWKQREFVVLIANAMRRTCSFQSMPQKKVLEYANQCHNNNTNRKEEISAIEDLGLSLYANLLTSKTSTHELCSGKHVMEQDDLIVGKDEREEALLGVDQTKHVRELEDLIAKPPSSLISFANVGEIPDCPTGQ